jgi:hypothetical protein
MTWLSHELSNPNVQEGAIAEDRDGIAGIDLRREAEVVGPSTFL